MSFSARADRVADTGPLPPEIEALTRVPPLARELDAPAQALIDGKTKPPGALGRLETLAAQIIRIQGSLRPRILHPAMAVFAGDHGIAEAGVSAYPQEVTWQMVMNFLAGGAAINVLCRQHGLAVSVVDAGVKHVFGAAAYDAGLRDAKIAPGTANSLHGPAMSAAQCHAALAAGAGLVDTLHASGCNLVAFGEMGIGNTAAAALLMHRLTQVPLDDCVGRGTGLDDAGLARKRAVLARASARVPGVLGPMGALAEFGGFEIAQITGACLRAAQLGMVLLVDGFIVTAAVLAAVRLAPAVHERCVYAHGSAERGHRALLEALGARPLLDLGLRLGEGSGAALAYPLLVSACAFVNEMADFDGAGVAQRS